MSKPKRPNRIHGRQKDQQIDKIKQQREEKRLENIAKLRAEKSTKRKECLPLLLSTKTFPTRC